MTATTAAARTEQAILRYVRLTTFHPAEEADICGALADALVLISDRGVQTLADLYTPRDGTPAAYAWRTAAMFARRACLIERVRVAGYVNAPARCGHPGTDCPMRCRCGCGYCR